MNVDYFKEIDTYKRAYFLGFILGDGAIVERQRNNSISYEFSISINVRDKYILDEFAKDIESERMPYLLKDYSNRLGSGDLCRFNVSQKAFVIPLMSWGITPRKSLTAKDILPNIPKEFRAACTLGLYDADGSFTFANTNNKLGFPKRQYVQIRCTESIAQGIIKEFGISSYHISRQDAIPNLSIGNKQEIINFLCKLYKDCPVFLSRKREKFNMLLSQVQTIS